MNVNNEEEYLDIHKRFFSKINFECDNGCWNWIAYIDKGGYGTFGIKGKSLLAHRIFYIYFFENIPENMHILHSCDNPSCVNPSHLYPGTQNDNIQDMIQKGRQPKSKDLISNFKLSEKQIKEIRKLYKDNRNKKFTEGRLSTPVLAEIYGVSAVNIRDIVNNRIWKHVV